MPKGKKGFQKGNKLGKKFSGGMKHWNWNGGVTWKPSGSGRVLYRKILDIHNPHADRDGYVLEHRVVMEHYLNRYLDPKEVVHHIDGNGLNNDINNLALFPSGIAHNRWHKKHKITNKHIGERNHKIPTQ